MPRNITITDLRSRWDSDWNTSHLTRPVAGFPGKIDDAVASFTDQRHRLEQSGDFTAAGSRNQLRAVAGTTIVLLLKKARGELIAARSAVAAKQSELVKPAIDKTDVAGAMLRREMRDHLRTLPTAERMAMLLESDEFASAYAELPALVPLPREFADRVAAERLEKTHGPELRQLEEAHAAFEIVGAMIDVATDAVRQELGLDERAFETFMSGAT
jgi:hypothetical protein